MLKLWLIFACFHLELLLRVSCFKTPLRKLTAFPNCFKQQDETCPNANITFQVYTSKYPEGFMTNTPSWEAFNTMPALPLKVLFHDFGGDRHSSPNSELLHKLRSLPNTNIISVEYKNLMLSPCFTEAVHNAVFVGRCVAKMLNELLDKGALYPQQLHLIGLGVGAHVAAFVANFLELVNYKVGHITGLDPAKALFLTTNLADRLDSQDADFVDIIHTNVFLLGILQPLGHVDFYPNMGVMQPNCGPIDQLSTHYCCHRRAAEYYAETIGTSAAFWGFRCSDFYAFTIGECQPANDFQPMGYNTPTNARGNYFLATNEQPPYAKDLDFNNLDRSLYGKTYLGDSVIDKIYRNGEGFRKITMAIG